MALGLRIVLTDLRDERSFERTFNRLPVRIGRSALNDLPLDHPFISQFHAVLEVSGDVIRLRDLGSKNGTAVEGLRVAPNTTVDLGARTGTFAIVSLRFSVHLVNVDQSVATPKKRHGTVLGLQTRAEASQVPHGDPALAPAWSVPKRLEQLAGDYQTARERLRHALTSTADPSERAALIAHVSRMAPGFEIDPEFVRLRAEAGIAVAAGRLAPSAPQPETLALQGLKELAASYSERLPPLESADDVIGFLHRLQDTLDVFFRAVVPLRDGHRQFAEQLVAAAPRASQSAASGVRDARTEAELARLLLDWSDPTDSPHRAVEGIFADVMIQQLATVGAIMRGVQSLLGALSPETIEEELVDRKRRGVGGMGFGPFRYKNLWERFTTRHSDLTDEDAEAFSLLFGPEFAESYARVARDARAAKSERGVRQGRPRSEAPPAATPAPDPGAGPGGTVRMKAARTTPLKREG